MALTARLALRQGQSLVMTPQLLQAIKLLQFSNVELAAFVEEELERNPLLERAEEAPATPEAPSADSLDGGEEATSGEGDFEAAGADPVEGDWSRTTLETDPDALAANLGTDI